MWWMKPDVGLLESHVSKIVSTAIIGKHDQIWKMLGVWVDLQTAERNILYTVGTCFTSLFFKFKVNIMTSTVEMCFTIIKYRKKDKLAQKVCTQCFNQKGTKEK